MKPSNDKKKFQIDIKTAFEVDKLLREGLAKEGLIPKEDARSIRSPEVDSGKYEVSLELDPQTAAAISQLLREGIISAAGAHQANNASVAASVGKVEKPKKK